MKKQDTIYQIDTLEFVDELIRDYAARMGEAMAENDKKKVDQFLGSVTALGTLRDRLMSEEAKEE